MRVWKICGLSLLVALAVGCKSCFDPPMCCAIPPYCLIGDDSTCAEHYVCVAYKGEEERSKPGDRGVCKMTCGAEKECAPGFACVLDEETGEGTCKKTCSAEKECTVNSVCLIDADAEEGICEPGCFRNSDCHSLMPACVLRDSETGLGTCTNWALQCADNEECPQGQVCADAKENALGFCIFVGQP